jgi:hypothetical protein
MPERNEVGMTHASWGGSSVGGVDCGNSESGMSGRGLSSSDGEGDQPLGGGGCGIEKVRSCGTVDDELADGAAAPRRNDSLKDGFCEWMDWNCGLIDASEDTRVEPS